MTVSVCPRCGTRNAEEDRFCPKCGASLKGSTAPKRAFRRHPGQSAQRNILFLIAGVALLGVALVLGWNLFNPSSPPTAPANSSVEDVHDAAGIPYPNVPRIELADAKARFDAKSALFVDVRGQSDYAAAHIPGAVSLPRAEIEARLAELPRESEILTYCT